MGKKEATSNTEFVGFVKKQFELQQKMLGNLSDRMRDMNYSLSAQEKRLDEIEQAMRGITRAIDKDSVKVIDHERRISRLEFKR